MIVSFPISFSKGLRGEQGSPGPEGVEGMRVSNLSLYFRLDSRMWHIDGKKA